MHDGGVCAPVHSRTDVASNAVPAGAVSLASGLMTCAAPITPDVVSAVAVGSAGAVTVAEISAEVCWPSASETTYLIGVAAPANGPVQEAPEDPVA